MGDCNVAVVVGSKLKVRDDPRVTTGAVWTVGVDDGLQDGLDKGDLVTDGMEPTGVSIDGKRVVSNVGSAVGSVLGSTVGFMVRTLVGDGVINAVGEMEGIDVWDVVGIKVGMALEGENVRGSVGDILVGFAEDITFGASVIGLDVTIDGMAVDCIGI